MKITTIHDEEFNITINDNKFDYQKTLTKDLDDNSMDFNQDLINEIVLWKVNRYVRISKECYDLINLINQEATELNKDLTKQLLHILINTKGVGLPMASTILRFRNNNIYQIIDQ